MTRIATLDGITWHLVECPAFHASGRRRINRCDCRKCRGTGYVRTLTDRSNRTPTRP